jgi:hypothetical protein
MAVDLRVEVGRGFEFESSELGGRGSGVVLKERGTGLDRIDWLDWTETRQRKRRRRLLCPGQFL